uniref:Uncharacterized protein n=1 Tax=Arundo donax TaxID=35708 RepID=A0A0A8YAR7_ARUDO
MYDVAFRIALATILYALSEGWTASKKTYLSASSHASALSKLHSTPVSKYPVPQHPRTEFSKPYSHGLSIMAAKRRYWSTNTTCAPGSSRLSFHTIPLSLRLKLLANMLCHLLQSPGLAMLTVRCSGRHPSGGSPTILTRRAPRLYTERTAAAAAPTR